MNLDRPIRILMLLENESYPEDCRVMLQAESLVAAGYQVSVICPTCRTSRQKVEQVGSVRVYRYPQPPEMGGFLGYALEYGYSIVAQFLLTMWVFLSRGFDAIHMHTPPDMNAVIPALFKLAGKKFIYDLHDLSPELFQAQRDGQGNRAVHNLLLRFERFASRSADLLIATNETQRMIQIDRCGASPDDCFVVRNGPNEAFLTDCSPKHDLLKAGKLIIGYVGVIGPQDGVDYLVRAVHELVSQRNRTDIQVVIVGNGSALGDLKSLVTSLGLDPYFVFTGMIPFADVPRHIAAFDICSTPDPSNAYNDSCTTIKTMEYMALGKPVVCFETSENVKTAGDAALYAANNDVVQYADRLEQLLNNSDLRRAMGQLGRKRVDDGLTWSTQAKTLVFAYDRLFGIQRQWDSCVPYQETAHPTVLSDSATAKAS